MFPGRLWRLVLGAVLLVPILSGAAEAANRWTSVGPYAGDPVGVLTVDPTRPMTLYASSFSNGVVKSVDGGTSWFRIPLGTPLGFVTGLAVDSNAHEIVYAANGSGVFKTTNGGASWEPVNSGLPSLDVRAIAVAPGTHSIVYAGVFFYGVFHSTDGGASWVAGTGLPQTNFPALAVDPSDPSTLYVSTDLGISKSTNGGVTWVALPTGLLATASIAIDPSAPLTVYAVRSDGVIKSTDGGQHWASVLEVAGGVSIALDPGHPSAIFVGVGGDVFRSFDSGATWGHVQPVPGSYLRSVAVVPGSPSAIYATTSRGIFRSVDAGATWTPENTGLTFLEVDSLAFDGQSNLYAGTTANVFRSANGGNEWSEAATPFYGADALAAPATQAGTAYAASVGGGVVKTIDGGATWSPMSSGLQNPYVKALAVDPAVPATVYAGTAGPSFCPDFCFPAGAPGVYKTIDGGAHWSFSSAGSPTETFISALAVDPAVSSTLYAGAYQGVYKSTDSGSSWSSASVGLPNLPGVLSLAIDPHSPGILYAGTSPGVFKSVDGGATWVPAGSGLPATGVAALVIDPTVPSTLYAGAPPLGVFRSQDSGATWSALNDGLTALDVWALAIDPASPSAVYAGTSPGGVFRLATEGPNICGAGALCLRDGRFEVRASWRSAGLAASVLGHSTTLTDNTGAFWFFSSDNIELVVKVLDGSSVNGKFWVFYGSLTNVEFTLTITDTLTGAVKTYFNPQGQLASAADTAAF